MAQTQIFEYKLVVAASSKEVYRAFTSAMVMKEWMCDEAQVDARLNGRLYLAWNSGYYMLGQYILLKPGKSIVFAWHGRDEPSATTVRINLVERNGKTTLRLAHRDIGRGKSWQKAIEEFRNGWRVLLENLQSVIETGIDLRVARRPMLGIHFGEPLNSETSAKLGVPVHAGIRLDGIVEGLGAHAAGLQKNDVLVSFSGKKISTIQALLLQLQQRRAGDTVKIVYYRGATKQSVAMELSPRSMPEIPSTPIALSDRVKDLYAADEAELRRGLSGVSYAEAAARPASGEWCVNEVIAHLICAERDTIAWIGGLLNDVDMETASGNLPARVSAVYEVYRDHDALLDQIEHCQQELVSLLSALPDTFCAHKGTYWHLIYTVLNYSTHTREHLSQIESALLAVRRQI